MTRAWELMAGALVAITPKLFEKIRGNQVVAALSLAAIFVSAFVLNSRSETPGLILIPTILGAAALLATGGGTLVANLLSLPPARFVGRISYSLYLWHWPILAFAHYALERRPNPVESAGLISVAVVISALSWKYIEQPFRSPTFPRRGTLALGVATLVAAGVASLYFSLLTKPIPQDQSPVAQKAMADARAVHVNEKCHSQKLGPINVSDECRIGIRSGRDLDFILIGDSHGDHFSAALDDVGSRKGRAGIQITHGGCLPIWDIVQMTDGKPIADCEKYRADIWQYIAALPRGRTIVMAARWSFYTETTGPNVDVPYFVVDNRSSEQSRPATRANIEYHLAETLDELGRLGHRVVLIEQLPEYLFFPLNCYVRNSGRADVAALCGAQRARLRPLMGPSEEILTRAAHSRPWVTLVSPSDYVCPGGECRVSMNGVFLYRDLHHLNAHGSQALSSVFTGVL
jgi:hypothetical protein